MKNNIITKICAAAAALTLLGTIAYAGNANPKVLPPNSAPYGQSYGAWSDAWWQWALSFPTGSNPMGDTTGEFGTAGQSGPVWFLAGVGFGAGPVVERDLIVPAGKALFFPLVNYVWVNTPQYGDPEWSPDQEALARGYIAAFIDTASDLTCTIDGVALKNLYAYRCKTPAGGAEMITLPEGNVWGIEPDTYGPMVTDGYYLMVAPLTPGVHTLHFTSALSSGTPMDVTYNLTIK